MTDWKQKIEAQIAGLRDFEVEGLYGLWVPDETEEAADTMQALLDVAVAAERMTEKPENTASCGYRQKSSIITACKALNKLREVGDD